MKRRDDAVGIRLTHSPGMADWLLSQSISLAFTSYQTGRLITVGVAPAGHLFFSEQDYTRAMGLHYAGGTLRLASLSEIWRLENLLRPGEFANAAHDAVFVPREARITGYIDAHEITVDAGGQTIFVSSRYSCLATVDDKFSFRSIWKPRFISALCPEDRCHLNGVALIDGALGYVTTVAMTDTVNGWRNERLQGGALIDVRSNEVVTANLSMPHSPRVHDGRVWLLDSGRGYICFVDPASGKITDHAFLPGFLRGMAIHGGHAIVAVSKPRESAAGLPFHERLKADGIEPWCGLMILELQSGTVVQFIKYETEVSELFDVVVMPGVRNPITIGPRTEELLEAVRISENCSSP